MSDIGYAEKYQFLYQVSREINKHRDAKQVLQCLVTLTQRYFQADAASIVWLEADGSQVFRAVEGPQSEKILGLRLPVGEGITAWVAEHGGNVWIPDVSEDSRFFASVDESTGFKTRSILAAPIHQANQIIAILEVVNPPFPFDVEEAKNILKALAIMTVEVLEKNELIEQARRYRKAFETCVEPGFLITQDGYLLDANRAARMIFHIEDAQCSKVRFDELGISSVSFSDLTNQIQNIDLISWDFVLNGAEARTYKAALSPLQVENSNRLYQWSAYDITDFISLEHNHLQLFNMLIHDLRVPLGSIHHSIELVMTALREKDSTIPVDQVLEIALRSEHRLERLVSDILDTTRLNSQTKTLTVTHIDIYELVQDSLNIVVPSAHRRNHSFSTSIQSDLEDLQGDIDLLQRVLINILGNAVKYTPDGGEINLTVYDDAHNVYFEISDNGPGVLPDDEAYIFELFFRGKTNRVKGAGIGLAFSKLAIEAHGGMIWLDLKVDTGAKFVFYIPKKLPESAIFFEEQ